ASLGHFADLAARAVVTGRPLLGSGPAAQPGSGAGGGIGFALLLLGARALAGADVVADTAGLAGRLRAADVGVTPAARFDLQWLAGGGVAKVAAAGLEVATPVLVIAGEVLVGRRESMTLGLSGAYPVVERADEVGAALADPVPALRARAVRVARTWSRR